MSCTDIARSLLFLANAGVCPYTGEQVLTPLQTRQVNALCMTCGTYVAACAALERPSAEMRLSLM